MRKDKVVSEVLGEDGTITPSDLYTTDFKRAVVGGYDRESVREFLERVADHLEERTVQVRMLTEKNAELQAELDEFQQMEVSLRNALKSSQKFGEDVLDTARREADVMLQEARIRKTEAEQEAERQQASLTRDIAELQDQRRRLRMELLSILDSHKLLVESMMPEMLLPPASLVDIGGGAEETAQAADGADDAVSAMEPEGPDEGFFLDEAPDDGAGPAEDAETEPAAVDEDR